MIFSLLTDNSCHRISDFKNIVKFKVDLYNFLLSMIQGCPKDFPKRYDVIYEEWKSFPGSQVEVSVSISPLLERMTREVNVREETEDKQRKIIH